MRTDRLGILLDQFDKAREQAEVRLTGLGDEEYLWEPVAGCWSLRRRAEVRTPRAFGPGEWVMDLGAADIPASEYSQVAEEAASGLTVEEIAGLWSVTPARVEEVLAFTGVPEPDETPVTTIAWRLAHLHYQFAGAWEWTFGDHKQDPKLMVDFSPSAAVTLERFWPTVDRWRESVGQVTDEQLDTVGFSQYPYGSDPEEPFISALWGNNYELIHHMAEIALLRDLYRARG
ncbi:DinB family protein [Streptomyces sp. A7024]|uniref:DinB family protein n=1 Tax=Streptomyces coryli TaxID=1128680 RepID=A0A6G4U7E9_9ACTN|nr:DinB family protein [Streptomyces coryli]NGN68159.1 DinB family protein [Streptomyces coryli]